MASSAAEAIVEEVPSSKFEALRDDEMEALMRGCKVRVKVWKRTEGIPALDLPTGIVAQAFDVTVELGNFGIPSHLSHALIVRLTGDSLPSFGSVVGPALGISSDYKPDMIAIAVAISSGEVRHILSRSDCFEQLINGIKIVLEEETTSEPGAISALLLPVDSRLAELGRDVPTDFATLLHQCGLRQEFELRTWKLAAAEESSE